MPTISLCMIVKNEEINLEKCLSSVNNYVNEIIVVDTGSSDKTKQIAKKYTEKVFDFKWINDFSAARNFSADKATMEWVLWLDADEFFDETNAKKLQTIITNALFDAYAIRITNFTGNGSVGTTHQALRLFKNIPQLRFKNKIHEQLVFNQEEAPVFGQTEVYLYHTGYTDVEIERKKKHERNGRLIKEELNKNPKNGYMNLCLANEYLKQKKYENCLKYSKKAYQYGEGRSYQTRAVTNIIQSLRGLKRYEEALEIIQGAKEKFKGYTELTFLEGTVKQEQGRMADAFKSYEKCIELGESSSNYQTLSGIGSVIPLEKMAEISFNERKFEAAIKHYTSVIKEDKFSFEVMRKIIRILKPTCTDQEIINYLDKIYSDDVQNELAFKMSILHDTRIKEGILKYSDKIKNSEDIENIEKWFYFSLFSKNNESMVPIVKELKKVNNKWYVYAFVFYFYTNNEEVKQFLQEEEMVSPLLDVLDGKSKKIKLEEDKVFIDILNEMLELKEYVVSEKLLSEEEIFHAKTLKNIGNVFYTHLKDGLAIEYYTKYLREYKADDETFTKTAELLLYSECFEEAILFAEQALQLNQKNFKPVEVLIESCKALSLKEAVDELCKSALKAFPDSPYILSNMENEA